MYPQHTDADGPAHPPASRPTHTTAVPQSQELLAWSTCTATGSPVDGPADSIRTGRPVIAEMPRASMARMANTATPGPSDRQRWPGPARSPGGVGRPMAHPMCGRARRGTADRTCSAAAPARRTGPPRRSARWASRACPTGLPRSHRRSPGVTPRRRPGRPGRPRAGLSGQPRSGTRARPGRSNASTQLPEAALPGQVPVEPLQRRPDDWALMPAPRHDLPADRLSGAAQRLAHHRGLTVSRPPPQEMDTADADTDLGMTAQADQGVLGSWSCRSTSTCSRWPDPSRSGSQHSLRLPSASSECRRPGLGWVCAFPLTEVTPSGQPRHHDREA